MFVLSMPPFEFAEQIAAEYGGEVFSTGCGSVEYSFSSEALAETARIHLIQAFAEMITVVEVEPTAQG